MKCATKCPPKRAPQLNVKVTLLRFDGTKNASDEELRDDPDNYDSLGTRWAEWKTRAGSERFASDITQAGHSHRLRLRFDSVTRTLTPQDRIQKDSRTFGIDAVSNEDEQNKYMILDVTETK